MITLPHLAHRTSLVLAGFLLFHVCSTAAAQTAGTDRQWPVTRPEATNYTETSRYDEVIAFMKAMAAASPLIHLTTYGYSYEGRPLPAGRDRRGRPRPPKRCGRRKKTRIYIQGNIHAGEVEGKEAALWLLRSIAKGRSCGVAQNVVAADQPDLQRRRQRARERAQPRPPERPVGGMGQRYNGQDLDLNRDNTKLETPEGRSLARSCSPSTIRTSRSTCTRPTAAPTAST
jgi:hypothetical protein